MALSHDNASRFTAVFSFRFGRLLNQPIHNCFTFISFLPATPHVTDGWSLLPRFLKVSVLCTENALNELQDLPWPMLTEQLLIATLAFKERSLHKHADQIALMTQLQSMKHEVSRPLIWWICDYCQSLRTPILQRERERERVEGRESNSKKFCTSP